ncbi:MAG: hypothetical protein RLZZ488_763 [Pseudomonadota bacterium]
MNDHNKHSHNQHGHEHSHHDCCGHEKHTHAEQHDHSHHHTGGTDAHKHGHDCSDHEHDHKHEHNHAHQHDHAHHHGHDCCDHDHAHGHHHLSSEECSSLFSQAQESDDPTEALDLLLIAGEGFAHLGDAVGTAAVNGLLAKKIPTLQPLSKLKTAQVAALKALELALNKESEKAKSALTQSVSDLEDFSGEDREEVEPLLADVRKQLAGIRTGGLKSLLSKFKF